MDGLDRFVEAQAPVYEQALAELRRGRKESHWMWFIFPQIAGLGFSQTARAYAIRSRAEAERYFAHPLLGSRLRDCTAAVLEHRESRAEAIFGSVDAAKFRSCMTLFEAVAGDRDPSFNQTLRHFYGGERDERTLSLLG